MKELAHSLQNKKLSVITLAFIAFVALGLPDSLLGVGWPSIRTGFGIPLDAIGLFLIASVSGYIFSSFISGFLLSHFGVGKILTASCFLTGLALIGYTLVPVWWMMVTLAIFAGLGAGAIDAGLNTYVAAYFGERLMQWLHASWGIGITISPLIMTVGLTSFKSWHFGYQVVGGFQIFLAFIFLITLPIWNRNPSSSIIEQQKYLTDYKTSYGETLKQTQVWLSLLLFFLYVGGEIGLGTWVYTLLTESRGVDTLLAGFFAGSYWFTFTIGRILAGLITLKSGNNKLVIGGVIGAMLGTGLLIWNPSEMANVMAVAIIGFSIAPIFPAMMSGTKARVGDHFASNTIGMQMAATGFGGAIISGLMGVLARRFSLEIIPFILFVVYASLLGVYILTTRLRKAKLTVVNAKAE
jgi:fucose permease